MWFTDWLQVHISPLASELHNTPFACIYSCGLQVIKIKRLSHYLSVYHLPGHELAKELLFLPKCNWTSFYSK